jgi:hypothetical protein
VLTVAVSVVAGVSAITSALPAAGPHAVGISIGFVAVSMVVNLRGVQETGKIFTVPTYGFVVGNFVMFAWGVLAVFLSLRAFAQGCTALTGVEAISNGVPAFRKPKSRNAALTLTLMGVIAVVLFTGITLLAVRLQARAQPDGNPSVISQIAASVFGGGSALFYLFQAATAGILILAANTAFNGFPVLASILGRDRYLPRQLHNRGDRLVFSNGILLLAGVAVALIIGFDANIDKLVQLYIIGVFTSFTLSQVGMVRHWTRELANERQPRRRRSIRRSQVINLVGAVSTSVVLVVVFATKVAHGAWLAVTAMILLFFVMRGIKRYYARVSQEISVDDVAATLPARVHAIVLVSRLHRPALRALALARATRPDVVEAVTMELDAAETRELVAEWERRDLSVRLKVLAAPYRDLARPLVEYVRELRRYEPRSVITVFIPEYVTTQWWQNLLHNQSALRLKGRLLFTPGVVVVNVPYHLGVAEQGWLGAAPSERVGTTMG